MTDSGKEAVTAALNIPAETSLDSGEGRSIKGFLFFVVILLAVFGHSLFSLARYAAGQDLHSHILLVPFVSAYLLYIRRKSLPQRYAPSPGWATMPFAAGLISILATQALRRSGHSLSENDYLAFIAFSFVCFLTGGGFLFLGRKWMAAAAFPFAFLIFMVPLPDGVADRLETASKFASAEAANFFFNITGTPVLRSGTVFQLPTITIRVAQECSGIRSTLALLIMTVLASHMFLKATWKQLLVCLLAVPLSIAKNGLRIATLSALAAYVDPSFLQGRLHQYGGMFFFAAAFLPLAGLFVLLQKGETQKTTRSGPVRI